MNLTVCQTVDLHRYWTEEQSKRFKGLVAWHSFVVSGFSATIIATNQECSPESNVRWRPLQFTGEVPQTIDECLAACSLAYPTIRFVEVPAAGSCRCVAFHTHNKKQRYAWVWEVKVYFQNPKSQVLKVNVQSTFEVRRQVSKSTLKKKSKGSKVKFHVNIQNEKSQLFLLKVKFQSWPFLSKYFNKNQSQIISNFFRRFLIQTAEKYHPNMNFWWIWLFYNWKICDWSQMQWLWSCNFNKYKYFDSQNFCRIISSPHPILCKTNFVDVWISCKCKYFVPKQKKNNSTKYFVKC